MKNYQTRQMRDETRVAPRSFGQKMARATLIGGAFLGVAAGVNAWIATRSGTPRHELGGVFGRYPWRFGDIAYTVVGEGTPLVLVHGLGAGNSMAEWSEVFPLLREHFTVYAFDFLGWGLSDQPDMTYEAADYVSQLTNFIEDVVGRPCVVAASSDGCAYAIEAAARLPNLVSQLVLTCPPIVPEQQIVAPPAAQLIERLVTLPIVGATLNNVLASRRSIEYFARHQLFYDKSLVDDDFVARHGSRAHRKGARRSLATFLSGRARLDARATWSQLEQPALLIWGRNAAISGLETAPEWLAMKPDAHLEIIEEAMLLPHYEHAQQWTDRVLDWRAEEPRNSAPAFAETTADDSPDDDSAFSAEL